MKKIIIALISAAFLTSQLGGCGYHAHSNSSSGTEEAAIEYTAENVAETMKAALEGFENFTEYDAQISQSVIDEAVKIVQHDCPQYFWLNGYATTTTNRSTSVSFTVLNDYTEDELRQMYTALDEAADDIISQIPAGSDDYRTALFIHDQLVQNTRYATEKTGLTYNGLWGNSYGCLVDGSAVCQGYAEAYQLIMQKLGNECGVCSGISDRGSHAWNYLKLDGDYYWVDVTWDDPESESDEGSLRHNYFMINDEMLLRTRNIGSENYFVPKCTSLDSNYFVKKNAYFSGYSPGETGRVLAENADSGIAEMMFADKDAYDSAMTKLFDEQEIWELPGSPELGYRLTYYNDDNMYVIIINY